MTSQQLIVGIDIGGTFTDIVILGSGGTVAVNKVPSSPPDYSQAIVEGILEALRSIGAPPSAVQRIVHATTVATNTVLEGKGALTGLLTTAGFRDVLEMRRLRIPVLYDIQYEKPAPLVPRRLRIEVEERMRADGSVKTALNPDSVRRAAAALRESGVEAVTISFMHSYANPAHELEAERLLRAELGEDIHVCRSADVLPEIREYERTSTAVVNAYVGPVVKNYLLSLQRRLHEIGVTCPIEVMQSAGGVMRFQTAIRKPAYLVESGPAAGVVASARVADIANERNIISFDMGGTTAKAAIIENGEPARTTEYEVGGGINLSSKLVKGNGYPIKLPFIDISEIGAGGGSIIKVDEFGHVSVGPQSAGAVPGPVCYNLGGTEATLTDALLTLGYINPDAIAGGSFALNAEAGRAAFKMQVADVLDKEPADAAAGVLAIAVATMTRAVKAVSTYRGRDPRDFALYAFGGNGAVVAAEIARTLQMGCVVVPPAAGVFSAFGLLYADVEQEAGRTVMLQPADTTPDAVEAIYDELTEQVFDALEADGYARANVAIVRQADLRYLGQAYELTVAARGTPVAVTQLVDDFHAEHERTYGHKSVTDPVEIVNLRVIGRLASAVEPVRASSTSNAVKSERDVYFGAQFGTQRTPVAERGYLAGASRSGPLIIEDYDCTCIVPPDCIATLDPMGNIRIRFAKELRDGH
jgi:N-methylhydantoinase A